MDIFDESLGFRPSIHGACTIAHAFLGEEVLKHLYKWTVPTHEMDRVRLVLIGMSEAETDERFA